MPSRSTAVHSPARRGSPVPHHAKKRPLSGHVTRRAILPSPPARKLSPLINVQFVVSQEVFGRYADEITSQPHSGHPQWGTENSGTLGKWRQPPLLKAWHTHEHTLPRSGEFYPLLAQVNTASTKQVGEGHRPAWLAPTTPFSWRRMLYWRPNEAPGAVRGYPQHPTRVLRC